MGKDYKGIILLNVKMSLYLIALIVVMSLVYKYL